VSPVASDPRLHRLREVLDSAADVADEVPDPTAVRTEAAVSVILRARDRLDLLLIKRATWDGDPWSGHMAFPGGRWERHDPGLLHTARRETREETGIDLAALGQALGRLVHVAPASPRLPKMRITPFVFGVPADTEAEVASVEVDSVHWVPVDVLLAPETSSEVQVRFPEFSAKFPSYQVVGEHVWGLTHRILTSLLERWPAADELR
jgi:8-oxo-dGTP pyrophosphatase MutT (NUDIX family)